MSDEILDFAGNGWSRVEPSEAIVAQLRAALAYEREQTRRRHQGYLDMKTRAEAAEAQLAAAREDGARSMVAWLAGSMSEQWNETAQRGEPVTVADVLAAWRAAQAQEGGET